MGLCWKGFEVVPSWAGVQGQATPVFSLEFTSKPDHAECRAGPVRLIVKESSLTGSDSLRWCSPANPQSCWEICASARCSH